MFATFGRSMATRISIQGLRKSFRRDRRETVAVEHVDLGIEPGEIFFLLGPSGCGKTTLLRMIAGFIDPTMGRILFDEADVTAMPPHQRQVGMVFQSYALWPHMSVLENVAFGLRVRPRAGADVIAAARRSLELVQMDAYAERRPNELSGGQQQRVALARALVVEPRVLLLDEPLSNLDAKLRADLRSEIRRVCKQAQTTTVYVTHDQKEALAIADRIAVLKAGRVCQVGTPKELYHNPADTFVAGFLGEINLFEGVAISKGANSTRFHTALGEIESSHKSAAAIPIKCQTSLCVRPERFRFASGPAVNVVQGRIGHAQFLGDSSQISILTGSNELRVVAGADERLEDGEACQLSVDSAGVMCFPNV